MVQPIVVRVDGDEFEGVIHDERPKTSQAVSAALPVEGRPHRWGHEFYVSVPFHVDPEDATETVDVGALAFWPEGDAVCLFFGETPASRGDGPRAASPVNVFGHVEDVARLREIGNASELQIERRH